MYFNDSNQKRKFFAAYKQAYANSLSHEQLTKPELIDFGLAADSEVEIELYNKRIERKRIIGGLCLLFVYLVIAVLAYIFYQPYGAMLLVGVAPPFCFLLYFLFYELFAKFFLLHSKTIRLDEYRKRVEKYRDWLEVLKKDFWTKLTGRQFEVEFGKLLRPFFDDVEVTKGSGDGGVDIIIHDKKSTIIVQCKNHKKGIGPEPVRALVGVMSFFQADKAVVVSLGGFTKGAKEFAKSAHGLFLYDLKDVVSLTDDVPLGRIDFAGKLYGPHAHALPLEKNRV